MAAKVDCVTDNRMPPIALLRNRPIAYQWGERNGISDRLGYAATMNHEAELWIGSHPKAPSELVDCPFTDLHSWETETGYRLPYLLKMLAVAQPLSIQAHPTTAQAERGFNADNSKNLDLFAAERNYKDPNSKPELVLALETGFEALCGFRDPADSAKLLTRITAQNTVNEAGAKLLADLTDRVTTGGLKETVKWALANSAEVQAVLGALTAAAVGIGEGGFTDADAGSAAAGSAGDDAALADYAGLITRLQNCYPNDPGILVAALLNHVKLAHGEALWLPPGTIHAYLGGYGIEIMGPSDNVLRGGLTPKHIDIPELVKITDFTPVADPRLTPEKFGAAKRFNPDAAGQHSKPFELLHVVGDAEFTAESPSCVLVCSGEFRVFDGERIAERHLKIGDAVLLTPGRWQITGAGECFVASGQLAP